MNKIVRNSTAVPATSQDWPVGTYTVHESLGYGILYWPLLSGLRLVAIVPTNRLVVSIPFR